MTRPSATPRPLADDEIEIIRQVARCRTNQEIAEELGVHVEKFRMQLDKIHARIGTKSTSGHRGAVGARVGMVAWAYENGLMSDSAVEPVALVTPGPKRPAKVSGALVDAVVDACEAIYHDRPRGDLRKLATAVLRDAGRLPSRTVRRFKSAA